MVLTADTVLLLRNQFIFKSFFL